MLWWGGRGRSPRDREKSHPDGFRYRLLPSLFSLAWQLRSCGQLPAATQRVVGPSFCLLALSPPLLFPLLGLSVSICTLTYVQVFTREGWALCALPSRLAKVPADVGFDRSAFSRAVRMRVFAILLSIATMPLSISIVFSLSILILANAGHQS